MLKSLSIDNIAVTRHLDVDFPKGYTVITGETGAGKSILIDCMGLLAGDRAGRDMIRTGENRACVCGVFDELSAVAPALQECGVEVDENGEVEIRRILTADGKSTVRINRRPASLATLREIGPYLIQIQTQDERHALADRSSYLAMLDEYAGVDTAAYTAAYAAWMAKKGEIDALKEAMRERNMLSDILKYQLKEIDAVKLSAEDEEDKLLKLRVKCKNAERIEKYAALVGRVLWQNDKGNAAAEQLEKASNALEMLSDVLEDAPAMAAQLENYRYEIIDIAERVQAHLEDGEIENPEKQLTTIESRLYAIDRLKKKYGATIGEIKAFRAEAAKKLDDMESGDARLRELENQRDILAEKAATIAETLHEKRKAAAEELTTHIVGDLVFLEMPKVRFAVTVQKQTSLNAAGLDEVDFLLSVNPGEAMQSLAYVASGGELSRVMLALKSSVSDKTAAGTLVFDEIDTGVSGSTAERIGIMLDKLSHGTQVIAVTHSPQVAARAKAHFCIRKTIADGRAESTIAVLTPEERVSELSRIIGGISVTEKQIAAAREMLHESGIS